MLFDLIGMCREYFGLPISSIGILIGLGRDFQERIIEFLNNEANKSN